MSNGPLKIDKRTVLPLRFATPQDDAAQLPKHEAKMYNNAPLDSGASAHRMVDEKAHISEKVYMLPESYNALRIELHDNFPMLFQAVGWAMAFDAPSFMQMMDSALDTRTTFDSQKVDGICKKYLDLLRAKRGLSPLHTAGEKA